MDRRRPPRDLLADAALIACLAATMPAEYALAQACGFGPYLSAAVPVAFDVYAIRAMRAHRDVAAVVLAMIAVNAASHLVGVGLLRVSWYLVVAVSAVAPLVLWRVHKLRDTRTEPVAAPAVAAVETPAKAVAAAPVAAVQQTPVAPVAAPAMPRVAAAAAAPRTRVATAPVAPATPPAAPRRSTPAEPATQQLADEIEEALQPVAEDLDGFRSMSVADVAAAKSVALGTVRSWVSRGKLKPIARDHEGRLWFHPNDVAELD